MRTSTLPSELPPGPPVQVEPKASGAALPTVLLPEPTATKHLTFWNRRLKDHERFYCYVIQGQPGTPIKIGKARNPVKRLATLQTGNPARLRLLYVIPGWSKMERALHYRMRKQRIGGEWFDGPGVSDFLRWMHDYCEWGIENLRANAELPPVPPLPPKRRTAGQTKRGRRWRVRPEQDAPIVIRQVEPSPVTPIDEARAARERYRQSRSPTG